MIIGHPPSHPGPETRSRWIRVSVPLPEPGTEFLLTDALRAAGARLVEREGERVVAYLPAGSEGRTARRVVADVTEATGAVRAGAPDAAVDWRWAAPGELADRWARDLAPRQVSDRIRVVPHGTDAEPDDDVVIRLLPGGAFGTAEHPTTRRCLASLERLVVPGARVLDVGAGSGILAVASALLGAGRVTAVEADGAACREARANVRVNGVAGRVRVRQRRVTPFTLRWLRRADLLVANLPPADLFPLLPHLRRAVKREGRVLVSGVPRGEAAVARSLLLDGGLALDVEGVSEGWWTGVARRVSRSG